MSYVRRNDGSMTLRGSQRTRVVPLIGTFLLLMAGFVVSAPGLMSASALGPNPVDLALTKSDDGLVKVAGGDSFDYTITVQNVGGSNLSVDAPVTVTDELPSGLVFVAFPANCAQAGQTLTCSIDPTDLDVYDGLVVITVTVKASADTASDAYTNVAYVETPQDPACEGYGCVPVCDGYSNNVDCESTTIERPETTQVVPEADLSIDKSVSQSTAAAGSQFNWFLAVTNHGPDPAANLVVNDALPAQFEVIGVFPPAGVSCTNTTSTVRCTATGLLIDKTVTVQVQVRVVAGAAAGLVANTGTVTADSPDPVPGNNSDTATITITTTAVASEAPAPAAPAAVSPELPATGNRSLGWPLSLAGLLCSAGVLSLIIGRRRRFATA